MLLVVALALGTLAPEPAEVAVEPAAIDVPAEPVVLSVVLGADARTEVGLVDELALRVAPRALAPVGETPPEPYVHITVQPLDEARVELRLVVSDGRLFTREVPAQPDERARVVAGAVANMIDAIEHNRLAPIETGVEVPVVEPNDPKPEPEPEPKPEHEPEPEPEPGPEPEPAASIGVLAGGDLTLGVGPPTAVAGITGVGGSLGVQLVHRSGALAGLDARVTAWRASGVALLRVRLSAVAGYAWQRERFELAGAIGPTVELLRIGVTLVQPSGGRRPSVPLLGGRLLARPSYAVLVRAKAQLRLALQAEVAAAFEARSPAGALQIFRPTPEGQPIARAGGMELSLGVLAEGRFALGGS